MPGFFMHVNAVMQCMHGAPAMIAPSQTRVLVSGQPVATMASIMTVAGCPFTVPPGKPQPCVLVKWLMPAARVMIMGQPAAVVPAPGPAPGLCQSPEQIPQGMPIVGGVQVRVIGT